jgi:hypothetical protein
MADLTGIGSFAHGTPRALAAAMRSLFVTMAAAFPLTACGGQISTKSESAKESSTATTLALDVTLHGDYDVMAADSSYLYVGGHSGIVRIPKDGGAPTTLYALPGEEANIGGVAVDDKYVYFTSLWYNNVLRLPKAGGPAEEIASGQSRPWGVVVDDTNVYWACQGDERPGVFEVPPGGQIAMRPKTGGDVVVLAPAEQTPLSLTVADGWVYFIDGAWGDANGKVRRVPVDRRNGAETLADHRGIVGAPSVLVADGYVIWNEDNGVFRTTTDGAASVESLGQGNGIAMAGGDVYAATADGRHLGVEAIDASSTRQPLGGRTFGNDKNWLLYAVSADERRVYWLDYWWSTSDPGPYCGVHAVAAR